MSKEIKLSLFALVVVPVLAVWFVWGRPARDATVETPPDPRSEPVLDGGPGMLAAPAPSVVAPAASESAAGAALEPPASSPTVGDGEVNVRRLLRHRPAFLKGTPSGCDPPYTVDSEGKRRYKKECF